MLCRGYFNSPEILACHKAAITVTVPKPLTSRAKSDGRSGNRTLPICQWRTPIAARPGSSAKRRSRVRRYGRASTRFVAIACPR
jgi:hypothetical protein